MDNFEQFTQLILDIIKDISYFINETFMSGFVSRIMSSIVGFLKIIVQFIIIGLEAIVRILKFFVK